MRKNRKKMSTRSGFSLDFKTRCDNLNQIRQEERMKTGKKIITSTLCVLLCAGCARVGAKDERKSQFSSGIPSSEETSLEAVSSALALIETEDEEGNTIVQCENQDGQLVTGFVDLETGTYYFETVSGSMVRDTFIASGDNTYYFDSEGRMVKGEQEIDGRKYIFDEQTGALKTDLSKLLKECAEYIRKNQEEGSQISIGIRIPDRKQSAVWNNQPQQSASVMKVFVMGAVYDNYEDLCATYGEDQVMSLLDAMITVSDNDAWSGLLTMLGYGSDVEGIRVLNEWCQAHDYHQTSMSVQEYENYTSAHDAGKILEDIENGELKGSEEMDEWLSKQALEGRLLQGIPSGVKTANKPGFLDDTENDTLIVYSDKGTYILTMLCTNLYNTEQARQMMKEVSAMVYDWMQKNL